MCSDPRILDIAPNLASHRGAGIPAEAAGSLPVGLLCE